MWHDIFKVMKGKRLQPRILHAARLSVRFDREIKSFPEEQKRIQHHQTSFTRTTKGTSLQRKHNRRKRPTQKKTQNNQENGKIIHTDNYFKCKWIKRTKRHRLAEWMKICACMPSHLPHHST